MCFVSRRYCILFSKALCTVKYGTAVTGGGVYSTAPSHAQHHYYWRHPRTARKVLSTVGGKSERQGKQNQGKGKRVQGSTDRTRD